MKAYKTGSSPPVKSYEGIALKTLRGFPVTATAIALLAVGCGDPEPATETGETFTMALDGAPATLDPVQASSLYSNYLVPAIFDTLYAYKYLARPHELEPNLARAMPEVAADGLTYTVRLRQGVRFHDDPAFGENADREVTADDVVYSLLRHFDPRTRPRGAAFWRDHLVGVEQWQARGSDYANPPAGIRALDRYAVRFRLRKPYPQFIYTLALGFAAIVPRAAVEHYGPRFAVNPVGSGPFMLEDFSTMRAQLRANPEFRAIPFDPARQGYNPETQSGLGIEALAGRSPPFVERLVVEFVHEDAARWASFSKGDEIQAMRLPARFFDTVLASREPLRLKDEHRDRFHARAQLEAGFVKVDFNMDDPRIGRHDDPERDQRNRALRCAIRSAFDWQARKTTFYDGMARIFPGVLPPATAEFDPQAERGSVRHDPDRARALLTEHGWNAEDLPTLEYGFVNSVQNRQTFEALRRDLAAIGYPRAKVQPDDYANFGAFAKAYRQREMMMVFSAWTMDYPDAQNVLQIYYGPNAAPGSNIANYDNPAYNRLYRRAIGMPKSPQRSRLYRRLNRMVIDDCVTISGLSRKQVMIWHRDIAFLPDRSFIPGYGLRYAAINAGQENAD